MSKERYKCFVAQKLGIKLSGIGGDSSSVMAMSESNLDLNKVKSELRRKRIVYNETALDKDLSKMTASLEKFYIKGLLWHFSRVMRRSIQQLFVDMNGI